MRSGDERLHVSLFDKVKNDEAAERARADLAAALDTGALVASPQQTPAA